MKKYHYAKIGISLSPELYAVASAATEKYKIPRSTLLQQLLKHFGSLSEAEQVAMIIGNAK